MLDRPRVAHIDLNPFTEGAEAIAPSRAGLTSMATDGTMVTMSGMGSPPWALLDCYEQPSRDGERERSRGGLTSYENVSARTSGWHGKEAKVIDTQGTGFLGVAVGEAP